MPTPLTPEQLVYGLRLAGDPQLSPDGSQIVYTLTMVAAESQQATSHLWVCDSDGANARRLTQSGTRNGGARWSPDGRSLAFVSERDSATLLLVLPLADGGEAREITRHRQAINDPAWSPDGRSIAYTTIFDPANPSETELPAGAAPPVRVTRRIDYKQDGQGFLNDRRGQIFVVDLADGQRRRLTSDAGDYQLPSWSPDGRRLAARRPNRNTICSQLAIVEVESGAMTLVGPEMGVVGVWSWSPTGDRILLAGDTQQTWQTDFFVYTLAGGELTRLTTDLRCLPDAGAAGLNAPSQPVWLDEQRALFHAIAAGASGLYTVDSRTGQIETRARFEALHSGLSVDSRHHLAVQSHGSLTAIGEVAVVDLADARLRVISEHNRTSLTTATVAGWEYFQVWRGETAIDAWLLKPPDFDPTRRYPVILDIHGGPNAWYGYAFNSVQQCLATHGYLVVYANPRGSGSYGRSFTQQVIEDWGGEDYQDLMAVVDTVLERPYTDRARVGIYGYSYGGFMTAWTIGKTNRFKAAVCGAPCFDLESFYGTSDVGHTFGNLHFGGPPHTRAEWYREHSPSTYAHRATTPTLIVHGEADERCPIGQGEQMFIALLQAGCEVEFVRYPGGYHGFLRTGQPAHRVDYLTRLLAWFGSHLR